ncbi:MAG: hypothetical protein IPH11_00770 [Ignavibacteriales bacterium]|nr:hypothetical protein [Ignavibacteriales bacterium]
MKQVCWLNQIIRSPWQGQLMGYVPIRKDVKGWEKNGYIRALELFNVKITAKQLMKVYESVL